MTTMMREELRDWCDGDPWIKRAKAILAHDASQRATIERLTKELSDEQTKTRQAVEEMVTILDQRVKDVRAERDAALRRAEEAEARCASYERERRETPSLALMEKLNAACAQLAAAEKEIERLRHNPQDCAEIVAERDVHLRNSLLLTCERDLARALSAELAGALEECAVALEYPGATCHRARARVDKEAFNVTGFRLVVEEIVQGAGGAE